jgi:D-alanine-D-alanine ligase
MKIGILLLTDSAINGKYSKEIILKKAQNAKTIIGMSGSSINGELVLSRSGSAQYKLESKLINKEKAENVSLTAMNFNKTLSLITDISRDDKENVIAPYEIDFKSNIFKEYAHGSAGISVRFNSMEKLEEIESKIKKIINQQKRSKIYQVHFEGGVNRPPMKETESTGNLFNEIQKIAKKIDVRISKEHRWSSSEICHISDDLFKIDGMGPVGEYLQSNNERIIRHSLIDRALLLALTLKFLYGNAD